MDRCVAVIRDLARLEQVHQLRAAVSQSLGGDPAGTPAQYHAGDNADRDARGLQDGLLSHPAEE